MSPNPPPSRRLPGVRFEAPPPALDEALPRMDIAFFVGFAASGPLGVPVALESRLEFEAVFGTGLTLARDAKTQQPVSGRLHPAVSSFFSQGGRRCWVLRVAGDDVCSSLFPLPGLLLAQRLAAGQPWRLMPATMAARSPGSGADGLLVATRIQTIAARASVRAAAADDSLTLALAAASTHGVRVGDLLRIAVDDLHIHGRVGEIRPAASDGSGRPRRDLVVGSLVSLRRLGNESPQAPLTGLSFAKFDDSCRRQASAEVVARGDWQAGGRLRARCRLPAGHPPRPGEVVRLRLAGGEAPGWMALDAVDIVEPMASDGHIGVELGGLAWEEAPAADARAAIAAWHARGDERIVQVLRLALQAGQGESRAVALDQLGMAAAAQMPGGGGSAFDLPDDERVFAAIAAAGNSAAPPAGRLLGRFPLASPPLAGELMLLPLAEQPDFATGLGALPSPLPRLQRDGLAEFSWTLFAEPALALCRADLLADRAEALRYAGRAPSPLRGMHAVFGSAATALVDEPTLLAVPDASHPGWSPVRQPKAAWTELPPLPEAPFAQAEADFSGCDAAPLATPHFVRGADPDADGSFALYWTRVAEDATYALEESAEPDFATATPIYRGAAPQYRVPGRPPCVLFYRVRALLGGRTSRWSPPVRLEVGSNAYETLAWQPDALLAIHRLMLRTAAGRGDMLAVLVLPEHYDAQEATAHAAALRTPEATRQAVGAGIDPPPIGVDERRALSHGALYHPWLVVRRVDEIIAFPPDGAVCGQFAALALDRGAWLAVANQPLRDVVALSPPALRSTLAARQRLFDSQVNMVRSAPHGFVIASADTLTPDALWRPINVRRLMSLLRRLALRRGTTYVFEPNGAALRRTVERGFEAVLDDLFRRGAFVGSRAQEAYRVEVGDDLNTARRRDLGQFWVELKVAPALPMSFLTVRLAREGERLVSREVH